MKNLNTNSSVVIAVIFLLSFIFNFSGPNVALAVTTPPIGDASVYGILANTYVNTASDVTINGSIGFATGPAVVPSGTHTNYGSGALYSSAGAGQAAAMDSIHGETCGHIFPTGTVDLSTVVPYTGTLSPGVYCVPGDLYIGAGGVTFSGGGTYIFDVGGTVVTAPGSTITLANGASANDVFWSPAAATTFGVNSTFVGTLIDDAGSGVTISSGATLNGRVLAFGGTISTDAGVSMTTPTFATDPLPPASGFIPTPSLRLNYNTLTVVKQVINDNGGTAVLTDFPLFVNNSRVVTGETFYISPGRYTITEVSRPGYTASFTGDCDANGIFDHEVADNHNHICTVVNDDIGSSSVATVPPLIDVVKVADPQFLPNGPGLVTYTYTVTNVGTVPMTDITLTGDTCSPIALASGDTNGDSQLDVNETWVYHCATRLVETTQNTVTVTGHANGLTATDTGNVTVVVGLPVVAPSIHITNAPSLLALPDGPGMVTYTKEVKNLGTVPLNNVTVTDDNCSPVNYISGDTNGDSKLDPGEIWVYTCTTRLTKTTTNTVAAHAEANGFMARAFAVTTVEVANKALLFLNNLRLGSRGADVKALQQYLNTNGYALAGSGPGSPGQETNYFGVFTKQALIKFQKDKKISPAVGYFGPVTRSYVNAHP